MCGIVGGISERNVLPIILTGLANLEYRGYDSVGIAVINQNQEMIRERTLLRVNTLAQLCQDKKIKGTIGIGHTRWATHGEVNQTNAHPHFSHNLIGVVHNGIIENFNILRNELLELNYVFESQTDTEVISHLIHYCYQQHHDFLLAVRQAVKKLHGSYAIGVINQQSPSQLICVKHNSPLIIGIGINEMFFASDVHALLPVTQKVINLEEYNIAVLHANNYQIYDIDGNQINGKLRISIASNSHNDLGDYRHYMQKEIFEQPLAISNTIATFGTVFNANIFGPDAYLIFSTVQHIQIIACGTSLHAGLTAKYWLEEFGHLSCSVDIASEYRYKHVIPVANTLIVCISQSGETADTIASLEYAHELGMTNSLVICNSTDNTLIHLAKLNAVTHAGPEIGVASTKAFTTQLVTLLYLSFTLAKIRGCINNEQALMAQIMRLPQLVTQVLTLDTQINEIARKIKDNNSILFLGRNALYPIALEGALKLKEISYIHAEAYAAGELKHGPLALIDENMPSIILMPSQILRNKMQSTVEIILARKGPVYLISDINDEVLNKKCHAVINMPTPDECPHYLLPILYIIPLQLLAYYTAIHKGTDVDKPRNLAKSVTVE